jgi:hypothetical protein
MAKMVKMVARLLVTASQRSLKNLKCAANSEAKAFPTQPKKYTK